MLKHFSSGRQFFIFLFIFINVIFLGMNCFANELPPLDNDLSQQLNVNQETQGLQDVLNRSQQIESKIESEKNIQKEQLEEAKKNYKESKKKFNEINKRYKSMNDINKRLKKEIDIQNLNSSSL